MIRRELKSRLVELEKRYAKAAQAKRDEKQAPASLAHIHAIEVAALVLFGEPKIAEPLDFAHERMQKELDKEFGAAAEESWRRGGGIEMHPALIRNLVCPSLMFDALPEANDKLKFERVFSKAPVWLLKFTGVEWDAKLLGFKLRKLVGAPPLGSKARRERNEWPSLPHGTIDAGGPCLEADESWETIVQRRCREFWQET